MGYNNDMTNILKDVVKKNKVLFWDIAEDSLGTLSDEAIIERIINYGDFDLFKDLFANTDFSNLRNIFKKLINKKRSNIRPAASNYLKVFLKNNYGEDL